MCVGLQVCFAPPTMAIFKESEVLFMFAVMETGGKQYKVTEGDIIFVEKLGAEKDETVTFDKVLTVCGETLAVGAPYVEGASVEAKVIANGKSKKIDVIKYKAKKNEKKKIGHRQDYTKILITKIVG